MKGLTPRQAQCLDILRRADAAGSIMPTYREIAAQMKLRSLSYTCVLIEQLEAKGYLTRSPERSVRAIVLTDRSVQCPACTHTFTPRSGGVA